MNLRPKTKRRLLALTAGGVVFTAAASVVVYIQLNREQSRQNELRLDGLGAYQRGEYATAIDDFKSYVSNDRLDVEALYAYAVSRSKVPLPDLGHLREAKSLFSRYLELKPDDVAAQHQLLDIYRRLNYTNEAGSLADSLLSKNPDDIPALSTRLSVLSAERKYRDALRISEQLNQLNPADLRAQETTFDLMQQCELPPAELTGRADLMLAAHPSDPRFELLRADAAAYTGDVNGARRWLRTAAAHPPADSQTLQMLAGAMDRIGMWDDARALIERDAATPAASPAVTTAWITRLWETGQPDQALASLKGVTIHAHADSQLLGLKALILFTRSPAGTPDPEATAILAELDHRLDDAAAACWSSLLHADFVEGINDAKQAAIFGEAACRQDPDNPIARFDLARAYLRLGENDLALKCLAQTTELAPAWATPFVLMARTLFDHGQIIDAAGPAQAAFDRDSASPASQTTLAIVSTAQPNPPDLNRLLALVKGVHTNVPDDPRVLAAYTDLLARTGHRQEAASLIVSTLASPTVSAGTLCDLLNVSDANHLELTDAITDRATHSPAATPKGICDQVRLFMTAGRAVDARRTIRAASPHDTPDWQTAMLQCREMIGETGLAPAWAALADANPADLSIQQAVLASRLAWTDRALIDRTITRCKTLTGDDCVQWRLARARWQLQASDPLNENATSVASAMSQVAGAVPTMLEPRLIWADALERLGDQGGAIAQLRLAHTVSASPAVTVELARLLASVGQYRQAVALVDSATPNPALSPASRSQAVHILRQSGETKKARELLENSPGDHTVEQDLLLARIDAELGDDVSAAHLYSRLMQAPSPSNAVLRDFAWFQASRGNLTEARETLKRLDPTQAGNGEIQLTDADFEAAFGTWQSAAAAFQAATNEARTNPRTWLAVAGFDLRTHDCSAALAAATEGLKWCAGDAPLTAMAARAKTLSTLTLLADTQPLIASIASDPTDPAAVALLNELATATAARETSDQTLARFAAVIGRYPRFLPAQLMLASRDADAGLCDDAIRVARQAVDCFPTDPDAARLLAVIDSRFGRWPDALVAATEWRKRSLSHPQAADNAIADAQEHLDHPDAAIEILAPFLPRSLPAVQASPDNASDDSTTVALYARAQAMEQHYSDLQTMLAPLCVHSQVWRHQFFAIIADTAPDAASARSQISNVERMIPSGSIEDRVALADARCTAGTRLADTDLLQQSLEGLSALTDAGSVPADAWVLLGAVQQQLNHPTEAETAYRQALAISPALPLAENNLATLILHRNGDLKEARQLAEHAVNADPANSTLHCTLGEVAAQSGDLDTARAQLDIALSLDPQNTAALVALADTQCRAAQVDKAMETLRRAENIRQITHRQFQPTVRQQMDKIREACKRASAVE